MRRNSRTNREIGGGFRSLPGAPGDSGTLKDAEKGNIQNSQHTTRWRSLLDWFQAVTFSPDWIGRPWSQPVTGYVLAILAQLAAFAVIAMLTRIFPTLRFYESLTLLIVFLLALGWGTGPALIATCAGATALLFSWLPSSASPAIFGLEHALRFLLYTGAGLTIGILTGRIQQARYTAQALGQHLEEIIDALPDPLVFYDAQGRALQYNKVARAAMSVQKRDLPVAQMPEALDVRDTHGERIAIDDAPLMRALRGEVVKNEELHYRPLGGAAERIISVSVTPLRARTNDSIIGAVTVTHDLSAQRLAEQEATRRARQLEAVFDAITDGVFTFDMQEKAPHLNRAAWDLLGIPVEERENITSSPPFSLVDKRGNVLPQEQWPEARIGRGERLQGDQAVDVLMHRLDGQMRFVSVTGGPLYATNGSINGGVLVCRDVTERRTLEQKLIEQASQLEAMLEAVPDALFLVNQDAQTIRMNRAARALLAIEDQQEAPWLGSSLGPRLHVRDANGSALPADQWPSWRILRGEVLTGSSAVELILRVSDGRDLFVSMTGGPVYDAEQRVVGAVTVARDVTKLRAAEQRVHASESEAAERGRQLEATFNAMVDGVVIYDAAGSMLRVNAAYSRLIALDKAPQHAHVTPAERAAMLGVRDESGHLLTESQQPVQRMLAGEVFTAGRAIDIQVHTLDGREVQLNITGTPIYDQDHALTGGVLIFRDVTERRALERRTQEALEALLTMAEELVHLPEQVEQEDTKVSSGVSKPLAELIRRVLGCKRVSLTAVDQTTQALHSLAAVGLSPEQEQLWRERQSGFHLSEMLEGTPFSYTQDLEDPLVMDFTRPPLCNLPNPFGIQTMVLTPMKVGTRLIGILVLDYGQRPHVYTQGELNLTKAVADLSALVIERERLQREQAAAQASVLALHETNRMMDEFIGIAGHELRTPLTTVKASVQLANRQLARLLLQQDALPTPMDKQLSIVKGHLDRTERQIGMQNRLVSDLLDVSRIHADRLELHPELCDLVNLIREVVEDQHYITPQRTLELSLNTPDEVLVLADSDRIRQVISNYLSNALKYSEASKPVQISVDLLDTQVRVSVHDEGPGLTPEQQRHIWERFYRAPGIEVRTGSGVGLGLGLHISRTIIERHDGHLGVYSDPPHGSTFWFTLPLAEQKPM